MILGLDRILLFRDRNGERLASEITDDFLSGLEFHA
jgi:hypothetical protein